MNRAPHPGSGVMPFQPQGFITHANVGVDKNSTVVFPVPLASTVGELSAFSAMEKQAAAAANGKAPIMAA